MKSNIKAGVTFMCEYVTPKDVEKYSGYIDYKDREEVKENINYEQDFSGYIEYMDSSSRKREIEKNNIKLFTNTKDNLTEIDKKLIKKQYNKSQEKGSLMWKGVFSFDTEWLKENEIINKEGQLNEGLLKESVRKSMSELIKREKFNLPVWTAEVHYNTKHFHVHTSLVEIEPKRTRGKLKQSTIEKTKKTMAFSLTDRSKEFNKINELIRENIVHRKKEIETFKDKEMKKRFMEIMRYLPEDKRQWQYGYNSLNHIKPKIDELSKYYIDNYCKKDFEELNRKLDKESENFKRIYGEGQEGKDKNKYKNYKENKIKELYQRMGNTFLTEMKEYIKDEEKKLRGLNKNNKNFKKDTVVITKRNIEAVKRGFRNDIQHMKNREQYRRLQYEAEKQNEMEM